jgi:hypothetical protein
MDPELRAFAEDPSAFVRIGSDEERIKMERAVVTFAPGGHFWSTTVARVRFGAGKVASELDGIRSLMRSRGRMAAAWSIGPSATPADVVPELTALGLEREWPDAIDVIRLRELPFGVHLRHTLMRDLQVSRHVTDAKAERRAQDRTRRPIPCDSPKHSPMSG